MNFQIGLSWFQRTRKHWDWVVKRFSKYISVGLAIVLAASASLLIFSNKAVAIDAVKVKYGAVDVSVSIPELVTFANTGQVSNQLRSLFQIAKASPEQVSQFREILGKQFRVNPNFLNEVLSTYYGRLALSEVSKFITPGSNTARIVDDLRSTINTVLNDGQISLLEVLQSYQGTDAIVIDGEQIVRVYNLAVQEGEKLITFLRNEPQVQRLLCNSAA